MAIVSLLIEDDYIEEFMREIPKEKVVVIEKEFEENKLLLHSTLESYQTSNVEFNSYNSTMKELSFWMKEQG